jgi:hypothetical protein
MFRGFQTKVFPLQLPGTFDLENHLKFAARCSKENNVINTSAIHVMSFFSPETLIGLNGNNVNTSTTDKTSSRNYLDLRQLSAKTKNLDT